MSGLREKVSRAIHGSVCLHPTEDHYVYFRESYLEHADAVLRVLAEHGDTQQVREQLVSSGALALPRGDRINAVMAVVAPHLAARDELIEQYKTLRQAYVEVSADEEHYATRAKEFLDRAERAEADLAAARMQVRVRDARLNQVRTLPTRSSSGMVRDYVYQRDLLAILDAPARPAGHDETGQ
jgi:hypothetical protein